RDRQGSVEDVARAGGINGVDFVTGNQTLHVATRDPRPASTEGNDYILHASRQKYVGGDGGGRLAVHRHTRKQGGLAFVGSQEIKAAQQPARQRLRRSGIENDPDTGRGRKFDRGLGGGQGCFQLEQEDVRAAKYAFSPAHIRRTEG